MIDYNLVLFPFYSKPFSFFLLAGGVVVVLLDCIHSIGKTYCHDIRKSHIFYNIPLPIQ